MAGKIKCVGCGRFHADWSWIYKNYEVETKDGIITKSGWFCRKWFKLGPSYEFVPERIKNDRKKYAKDILQPWRQGVLSKEYLDVYGSKGVGATKEDIKKAKNVWKDIR